MNFSQCRARVCLTLSTLILGSNALAADKELLDILLSNGAITQEQFEHLAAKPEVTAADVSDVVVKLDQKGLNVSSQDGDYAFKIGSRLHFQASGHSGDLPSGVEATDGTEVRRARFEAKGTFNEDWIWAAEADFADNETAMKDFWLGYKGAGNTRVYAGHNKQPYSLSLEMSSNDIPFIERSIDNDLIVPFVDRALGVRLENSGSNWFAAGGIYGEAVDANKDDDEGWGAAARYVFSPIVEDDRVLHLGVRAAARTPSASTEAFRIRDETTHQSNLRIVDTGTIGDIDRVTILGAEAGFAYDAFSIVGEYNQLGIDRNEGADLNFDSWHVYATYTLTGESRAKGYKMSAGEFKRITPIHNFNPSEGTWGAWELAMRYAHIDVNDGAFIGGDESVLTSALNWYLTPNSRLMFEWSRIIDTDGSNAIRETADGMNIFQVRTQYTF